MIPASFHVFLRIASIEVANHLWQSTLVALVLGAVAFAFRNNHARVRFAIWLAASIKFLLPFSLLVGIGSHLAAPRPTSANETVVYSAIDRVGQPFSRPVSGIARQERTWLPASAAGLWLCGSLGVLGVWCLRWRRVSAVLRRAQPCTAGREFDALRELERECGQRQQIPLRISRDSMEPGIFGIVRPCLIWPIGISEHLSDAHLSAILAHELWHVRRRDNLAAALHMVVQAAFWFHPLVWWMGARLVEERERACDEQVLRFGGEAHVYAESILRACKFCVEAPLACVAGVAGSDLKRRIARIMQSKSAQDLSLIRRLLLTSVAAIAVTGPIAFGMLHATQAGAQEVSAVYQESLTGPRVSFDSATVKRSLASDKINQRQILPNEFIETNGSLRDLIAFAYGVNAYQVTGGPDWIDSERFNIDAHWKGPQNVTILSDSAGATVPPPPPPGVTVWHMAPYRVQSMLQTLLVERFHIRLAPGSQQMAVYDLVAAEGGAKLKATPESPAPATFQGERIVRVKVDLHNGDGEIALSNGPVSALAGFLSQQLGHQVTDKTGIAGSYDMSLRWAPGSDPASGISGALQEQLGLKLEPAQGTVSVLTIDQADEPAED
jgi:uncharacterized protein (TIGR03435 family)